MKQTRLHSHFNSEFQNRIKDKHLQEKLFLTIKRFFVIEHNWKTAKECFEFEQLKNRFECLSSKNQTSSIEKRQTVAAKINTNFQYT
jgi:hypothetical protein